MPASCDVPHQCLMTALKDMQASQAQAQKAAGLLKEKYWRAGNRKQSLPLTMISGVHGLRKATAYNVCSPADLNRICLTDTQLYAHGLTATPNLPPLLFLRTHSVPQLLFLTRRCITCRRLQHLSPAARSDYNRLSQRLVLLEREALLVRAESCTAHYWHAVVIKKLQKLDIRQKLVSVLSHCC